MSYGIVRVQKFTAGSVKGIEIHDRREKDKSHTNPDIDFTKSKLNYDLHHVQNRNFRQTANERISQLNLSRAVRKDAIVIAQVLVTSDKAFFDSLSRVRQDEFFKDSYNFLAERYGKENIISAIVHLDEKTPHMHFNFVPVTADGRLSAKSVLTRLSLTKQQDAFYEQVGIKYDLQRGEPKDSGKIRKHLETAEYKKAMLIEQDMCSNASNMAVVVQNMQEGIKVLEKQKNVLERKISTLESDFKGQVLTVNELNQIKPEKGLMGSVKNITVEDIENLKKTAFQYVKSKKEFKNMSRECDRLKKNIKDLRSKLPSLTDKASELKEKERLEEIEKAFLRLPTELREQVLTKNNQTQERGIDRGR